MIIKIASNSPILSSTQVEFYQQSITSAFNFNELGASLIHLAERARASRHIDKVKEYGLMLVNLPLKKYQVIGQFYLALASHKVTLYEQAIQLLEQTANNLPDGFLSHDHISRGALEAIRQNSGPELEFYMEYLRRPSDLAAMVKAIRMMDAFKAKAGLHESAVKYFDEFLPFAAISDSPSSQSYINSLTIETGADEHIKEARNIKELLIASPLASIYQKWLKTYKEIELKSKKRSLISIKYPPFFNTNVIPLPENKSKGDSSKSKVPASLIDFNLWKALNKQPDNILQYSELDLGADNIVQAGGFQLLGLDGQVRASLHTSGDRTVFSLFNKDDMSIGLVVSDDGLAELSIFDRSQQAMDAFRDKRISIGIRPQINSLLPPLAGISITGKNTDNKIEISLKGADENPLITLFHSNGKKSMELLPLDDGKLMARFYNKKGKLKGDVAIGDIQDLIGRLAEP